MSITAREFKVQFAAVSSMANWDSPVAILMSDGTVFEISQPAFSLNEDDGTLYLAGITPEPPPVVTDPPTDPDNPGDL